MLSAPVIATLAFLLLVNTAVNAAEVFAGCFNPSVIDTNRIFARSYVSSSITCPAIQPDASHLIADSSCPYPNLSAELIHPPANWGWYKCFDFLSQGPAANFTVQSRPECLTACSAYPNAYFSYLHNSNKLSCACYQRGPPFTIDQCGLGIYYHYYHTFGPSDLAKRRMMSLGGDVKEDGLCPGGLKAYKITEEDDYSFECIDTDTELDSCGGCMYGEVDGRENHDRAVNCLTLPGVLSSGMTCEKGRCKPFSCEDGHRLEANRCVLVD
ncbi:hypothetical protein L486_07334 [Kwoniella mangroviensis CBS 10435]|uniref:Protein CPL1-like domain-containing protein n=1 Tax=Kwoniella mangroviensis CBS 10435 TaxID=1331196 RepID=A0A1B9IIH9_9TREE|nr:hypothetical protein L486_07334 [Kwoniella mangroviensis CBS 10435]